MRKPPQCVVCRARELETLRNNYREHSQKWRYYERLRQLWLEKLIFTHNTQSLHLCSPSCRLDGISFRKMQKSRKRALIEKRRQAFKLAKSRYETSVIELHLLITELGWEHPRVLIQQARVVHFKRVRGQRLRLLRELSKK